MSVESLPPLNEPSLGRAPVWRFQGLLVALAVLMAGLSVWLFWDGLYAMWGWWMELPEYSHGILIPPIAAFLVWQQKDRLERLPFSGSWPGVALVLLGGALLMLGQFSTTYTLIQYAYLVTLAGLALSLTGSKPFRLIAVPLLVLVLMIPLPQFLLANISTKLQLLSSQVGVWFIRLFGISVFVEGNVIDLGGYKLEVAQACDGLRYLFPLMTLGFLMAYFYKGATWKRVTLFASSIPLTMIMNSLRIGTIGVMVEYWGIAMAEGFLHQFQGWAVFMMCACLMLGEIAILNRVGRESGSWRQLFGVEFPLATPKNAVIAPRRVPLTFVVASSALVLFVAIALFMPRRTEVVPARATFSEFPLQIGEWSGRRSGMEQIYLDALKVDDYLLADYFSPASQSGINLYMAYYGSQRKGEAVHSPRSCLPGGGWQLSSFDQRTVGDVRIDGRPLHVNRTLIALGDQQQLVYYWFQQRGRVITNEFAVKWYLFWDAVTRQRTDGALVRLIAPVPRAGSVEEADRQLTELASRIAPTLTRYVPD